MGIITGYICLICFIMLGLKYLARKLQWKNVNSKLMKMHKYIACAFLLMMVLHFILVIPVLDTRMEIITISGILAIIFAILLIAIFHVQKDRKIEIKFHRAFSLGILVMIILHMVFYYVDFNNYKTKIADANLVGINLEEIADGEYIGEYDAGYIMARVKVTVKDHKIISIDLIEHKNERGSKAETILDTMIDKQNIDVDAVSGATNSSKVIQKACENALRGNE